jgi:hypothetical protein
LLGAGSLALAAGLLGSFRAAVKISELVAPSAGAGFGLALLSLAFLPNAAVAGMGFVTGAGFTIGPGSYSPFGSSPVELPAVPLLAAVPDGAGSPRLGMLVLAIPVLIAVVMGWWIDRRLDLRWQRMAAAGTASVLAGLTVAGLAVVAAGGVAGGPWSSMGVPPLLAGGAVAGVVGMVSLAWTGVAGMRTVPWRAARPVVAVDTDADADDAAEEAAAGGAAGAADGPEHGSEQGPDEATTADGDSDPDAPGPDAVEAHETDGAAEDPLDGSDGDVAGERADPADVDGAEDAEPSDDAVEAHETDDAAEVDEADPGEAADELVDGDAAGTVGAGGVDDTDADAGAGSATDPVPDPEREFPGASASASASGASASADGSDADADRDDGHQRAG